MRVPHKQVSQSGKVAVCVRVCGFRFASVCESVSCLADSVVAGFLLLLCTQSPTNQSLSSALIIRINNDS